MEENFEVNSFELTEVDVKAISNLNKSAVGFTNMDYCKME